MMNERLINGLRRLAKGVGMDADGYADEDNGSKSVKTGKGKWITTRTTHKRIHIDESGNPDKGNPYAVAAMNGALKKSPTEEIIPNAEVRDGKVVMPKHNGNKIRLPNGNIAVRIEKGGKPLLKVSRPFAVGDKLKKRDGGGKYTVTKSFSSCKEQKDHYELEGEKGKTWLTHKWVGKPITGWRKA